MIDEQLATFLEDGVGIHIGTRNQHLEPNGARVISARVGADRKHLTLYMASVAAARVMPDLEANGAAAVVFARPVDDRACQVKGVFVATRAIERPERDYASAQWAAFLTSLEYIGIPRAAADTWISDPDLAVTIKVTAIFEQTPGPSAGTTIA